MKNNSIKHGVTPWRTFDTFFPSKVPLRLPIGQSNFLVTKLPQGIQVVSQNLHWSRTEAYQLLSRIGDLFFIPTADKFTLDWEQGSEIAIEPFPNNRRVGKSCLVCVCRVGIHAGSLWRVVFSCV